MALVSVVSAFYNEATNIAALRHRLERVAAGLRPQHDCEFVLVDDHSHDGGSELVRAWARQDARVRYIRLARNAGSHAACTAGLRAARGACAVVLAADLQDPPETIPTLLERWQAGHDVVWAVRAARAQIPWTTRVTAGAYYWLMRRCALANMPERGADFLLLDRKVIRAYLAIAEKHTSFLGMILWLGFRQTEIEYVKEPRAAGVSKWTLRKKLKLFTDSLLSFSTLPVRIIGLGGLGFSLGTLGVAALVVLRVGAGRTVPGWAWCVLAVFAVGACQLAALAIIAEYLWRTFDEVRGRPRYVIEETSDDAPDHTRNAAWDAAA